MYINEWIFEWMKKRKKLLSKKDQSDNVWVDELIDE